MGVLEPQATTTIKPRRPTETFGEETLTPEYPAAGSLPAIDAVVSLGAPVAGVNGRYTQGGTVFVPRGSDLRAADKFTYNGDEYRVVGKPRGDQLQPFTGDDLGWMALTIEGAG